MSISSDGYIVKDVYLFIMVQPSYTYITKQKNIKKENQMSCIIDIIVSNVQI